MALLRNNRFFDKRFPSFNSDILLKVDNDKFKYKKSSSFIVVELHLHFEMQTVLAFLLLSLR